MGNQQRPCCSALATSDYSTVNFKQLRRKKPSQIDIRQLFQSLHISPAYQPLFVRFYHQLNQQHLFQTIQSKTTIKQRNQFMQALYDVDIDILDSLFYNTKHFRINQQGKYQNHRLKQTKIRQKKQNIYFDQNQGYSKQCDYKIVDVTAIMTKNQEQYEKIKQIGLAQIKQGKSYLFSNIVCFIILNGGKNYRFGKNWKELQNLQTPSERNMIERILHRYNALGQMINKRLDVFILCNYSKQKQLKTRLKENYFSHLQISFMNQLQMGSFTQTGRIFLNQQGMPELFPTGTGEIWEFIKNQQQFGLASNKYKYIYFVGVSNAIEHCFDCYMLGRMQCQGLQWATKIVDSLGKDQPKIYLNTKSQVQVCDPQEIQFYPTNCNNTFTNHSIVSTQLIKNIFRSQNEIEFRHFRKKTELIKKSTTQRIKVSKNFISTVETSNKIMKIVHFENYFSDIFKMSENYKLFKYFRYDQYYPFLFYKHLHSDISHASQAICQLHKKWLSLSGDTLLSKTEYSKNKVSVNNSFIYESIQNYSRQNEQICEIDPYVSLQGQNLTQVKYELLNSIVEFPIFICSQEKDCQQTFQRVQIDGSK